jgi:hypothetical protein
VKGLEIWGRVMFTYKAAYRREAGLFFAETLDFP